ncbi:AsmA family protein [Amphritea sp. 1_MG-2023]|uniref:AsmA family protein n=1 Tax=Amphritea sp. 1_MG-2023 TaxID=3062670 RepID=UPI0026E25FD0|nr:AsmA family protein [Amphritea sp. 1_MG-2023]MDO6564703.1 AsmA family protein [Amphritea sp. 1_MG-2023]
MKTLLKIFAGLIALLLIVVVAGGILLGMFFDPNEYKPEIKQLALEKGGIQLEIDGDLGWSVFPWLGIEINQIKVNYPGQPQLAELNQAQVSVELPALLSGNVKMSSILLDGLTLNLEQSKQGNNWAVAGAAQPSPESTPETAAEASGGAAIALDIESIAITNGNISYNDTTTGSKVLLKNFSMTSGKVTTGTYFPAELSFQAEQYQADKKQLTVDAALSAEFFLDLAKQQYNIKGLASTFGLSGVAFNDKTVQVKLNSDIEANLANQTATLKDMSLSAANVVAKGDVSVTNFSKPVISGNLNVAQFSLQALLAALGQPAIETSDPEVLKAISFNAQLGGAANTLGLNKMSLKLDDTRFNGSFAMNLATGSIAFNMKGDELNADRYLPPASEQPAPASSNSKAKSTGYSKEPVIPVELLKGLNMDVDLGLTKLLINQLTLTNLELATSAHGGLVNISKLNADMYSGTLRNSVIVDVRKSPTKLTVNKNISNIQIGDLLMDMAEVDRLTGTFNTQAKITAQGDSVHAIVNSLNGNAHVTMPDGAVKGIDIAQTICQGFNNISALGIDADQVDRSTPFADLSSNFKFTNGVISNQDLITKLDAITLRGKGSVDLPAQDLDYRLGLTIEENLFKKTCAVNNNLEGVEWPVNCKGSFDTAPAQLCRPDTSVLKELLKQKAKKQLEGKLMDKLGGGEEGSKTESAKKLLKGLFGN